MVRPSDNVVNAAGARPVICMGKTPDDRPLFIFDGDCGFCRMWVEYWRRLTGDRVR
jgi:hypothetical protein